MTAGCHTCNRVMEDILHASRDCGHAREVWNSFYPQGRVQSFFYLNLRDWVIENLRCTSMAGEDIGWSERKAVTCWALWKWRNAGIFENETLPLAQRLRFLVMSFEEAKVAARGSPKWVYAGTNT